WGASWARPSAAFTRRRRSRRCSSREAQSPKPERRRNPMEAVLEVEKRTSTGKNENNRTRAAGRIPAVVYGAQKAGDAVAPVQVAVDPKPFLRILHSKSGL